MGLPDGRDRPDHPPSSPHQSGATRVRESWTSDRPRVSGSYSYHPDAAVTGRSAPERTQPRRAHTPAPERDERPSFPPALPGGEDLFEELERMPVAILLVGSGNALVFANRQARLLLERGEALCLDGQRLRCTDRESDVRLFRAVEVCVQAARDGEEHRLAVDLISPRQRLEAAVSASARGDGRRPAAVVMVRAARAR